MTTVKFGTDGIRGRVGEAPIDCQTILNLGWALGAMLKESFGPSRIIIGKDTRISGYMIESLLEAGIIAAGCDAVLLGPVPTPGIAYLTKAFRSKAGIVISASHNVYLDNGIKFFNAEGFKFSKSQQDSLLSFINEPISMVASEQLGRAHQIHTASERYVEFCKSKLPSQLTLSGLKIVIDCANGANYKVGPEVFSELGADVIKIFDQPDGTNINQACGSLHPNSLKERVLEEKADLGVGFDGDGDRVILVSQKGRICDGDDILYILGQFLCHDDMGVVGTIASNNALKRALQEKGIPYAQTQVGDHQVIASLLAQKWLIGGEPSGHIIQLDKNTCSDAIITALSVIQIMLHHESTLDELIQPFVKMPNMSFNIPMTNDMDLSIHQQGLNGLTKQLGKYGKLLVRPSGTEPLVRVLIEGEDQYAVKTVCDDVKALLDYA